ncbi:hypothetical protein D3C80_2125020 [compost metagenome]
MAGARTAARYHRLRSNGEANHRRACRNRRLQNRVNVIQAVAVRRDILGSHRESNRELPCSHFLNPQQIFTDPQDVAFFDSW